jgi:hypothetical protein
MHNESLRRDIVVAAPVVILFSSVKNEESNINYFVAFLLIVSITHFRAHVR